MANTTDETSPGPVAIVGGTGDLGFALALRLTSVGVPVRIGSRDAGRAQDAAGRVREQVPDAEVDGFENTEAVKGAPLVVLSVPFAGHAPYLKQLAPALEAGQIVLDATVPLATAVGDKPTRVLGVWGGSAAGQARELLPDEVGVVAGLHTVSAVTFGDLEKPADEDVLLCSDSKADTAAVAAVLNRIPGIRCVDCGRLERAQITEQLTALLISINLRNKTHAGIRITGLD
jgi:NADPH-dependent F420 reductase